MPHVAVVDARSIDGGKETDMRRRLAGGGVGVMTCKD